jgi:hypothetical protein
VPDLFAYDLADALRLAGCPLCRTVAADEERWMASFWREGTSRRDARLAFYDGGGFCRRHAWLLERSVAAEGAGAAIADVYGALADRDLQWLDRIIAQRSKGGRRRDRLERGSQCSACIAAEDALSRKVYFLVELLHTGAARELYRASEGLCFPHLVRSTEESPDEEADVVSFLLEDWRDRLAHVRALLAEFDRKRDVHYADEPKGEEQGSWIEIIRLYVGEDL